MAGPFLHETPPELLQSLTQRQIKLGSRTFTLTLPVDIDPLLDHPSTHAAFESDEYLPYWANLWPSAQMLAEAILSADRLPPVALEIGCGLGLSGLTALSRGCQVTFSDYDATALQFAAQNARQNGFAQFELLQMDWRYPPASLKMPWILAADVIYEARQVSPVVQLIHQVLTPDGECWLVDPDRPYASDFRTALTTAGLAFRTTATSVTTDKSRSVHGTLYTIVKAN